MFIFSKEHTFYEAINVVGWATLVPGELGLGLVVTFITICAPQASESPRGGILLLSTQCEAWSL